MRTGRRRAIATLGVVVGMAVLAGLVAAVVSRLFSSDGPVYTVAQVRAGLARQPAAWAGRTLLVRGSATQTLWGIRSTPSGAYEVHFCNARFFGGHPQFCALTRPNGATVYLTLIDDSARIDPRRPFFILQQAKMMALNLAVQPVAPNPLVALARRLPPLARFLPMQGQVPGGVSHLYRIRLQSAGSARCAQPSSFDCAAGVLVDAQP